jgi:hypothetical protein
MAENPALCTDRFANLVELAKLSAQFKKELKRMSTLPLTLHAKLTTITMVHGVP